MARPLRSTSLLRSGPRVPTFVHTLAFFANIRHSPSLTFMSILLLTGIVLTVVPTALILGFALFTFFAFTRDDPDAKNAVNVALVVLAMGIVCLIGWALGVNI